jgi:transposase
LIFSKKTINKIDVREQEKLSIRKLAQRFQLATGFMQKLLKEYQETGDIIPLSLV